MFVGLRYLNKTTSVVIYDGGHGFSAASFVDQTEVWNRIIGWFDRFLKTNQKANSGS